MGFGCGGLPDRRADVGRALDAKAVAELVQRGGDEVDATRPLVSVEPVIERDSLQAANLAEIDVEDGLDVIGRDCSDRRWQKVLTPELVRQRDRVPVVRVGCPLAEIAKQRSSPRRRRGRRRWVCTCAAEGDGYLDRDEAPQVARPDSGGVRERDLTLRSERGAGVSTDGLDRRRVVKAHAAAGVEVEEHDTRARIGGSGRREGREDGGDEERKPAQHDYFTSDFGLSTGVVPHPDGAIGQFHRDGVAHQVVADDGDAAAVGRVDDLRRAASGRVGKLTCPSRPEPAGLGVLHDFRARRGARSHQARLRSVLPGHGCRVGVARGALAVRHARENE